MKPHHLAMSIRDTWKDDQEVEITSFGVIAAGKRAEEDDLGLSIEGNNGIGPLRNNYRPSARRTQSFFSLLSAMNSSRTRTAVARSRS